MDESPSQVGKAWCSPHACHPSHCFGLHNPKVVAEKLADLPPSFFKVFGLPACQHQPTRFYEIEGYMYTCCDECNPFD